MRYLRITCFLLLIIVGYIYSDSWHIEVVDSEGNTGMGTSIALDSKGNPCISYTEIRELSFYIKYAHFDGNEWKIENIDIVGSENPETRPIGTSLALDNIDLPYIAYFHYPGKGLKLAHFDGQKWNIEIVDTYGDIMDYPSLLIDSDNHPHIAYSIYSEEDLKYAYFDGKGWNIEYVDKDSNIGSTGASLDLFSNNYPCISYCDRGMEYLKYAYWNGTSWQNNKIDRCYLESGSSVAIDSNDHIHILYEGYEGLSYAYFDGNNWNIMLVETTGWITNSGRHLVVDSNNRPHISYEEGQKHDLNLKYGYFDGNKWNLTTVDSDGNVGSSSSIVLDSKGNPHISYYDATNGDLKYAWYGPNIGITLTSFSAMPNNDAITLNWSVSTDEDISGFNLYRRIIAPFTVSTVRENSYSPTFSPATVGEIAKSPPNPDNDYVWTKVNTSLITGTNPYSYTDRDITPDTNYEYKLEAVTQDNSETLGTTSVDSGRGTPESFNIVRIYPTPAYYKISIDVIIPEQSDIDIAIYDIAGRRVAIVVSGLYNSGEYTIKVDVSGLTDGVYIVRMTSEGLSASKRFVVAK